MELDYDQVREFLMAIEDSDNIHGLDQQGGSKFAEENDMSRDQLAYMVMKLKEGNLITGSVKWASNEPYWINPGNLTYSGHEYLNNIRDSKVWEGVKTATSKVGSVSLSILVELAKQEMKKRLGLL
ncbi:DUF2513 domain-containing protein [Lactobacillus rhamnosus]|uniref:DUF2513 domain-containing protein n=1 Tax=Lacticaseibacillus rhamnosus TaxID=47715 RepID=A0A7Y7UK34_LACRH|nr:DUF2513 domain-containing protein [Lacticaseibacillus rhamnosus]NVO88913.1 DUF2513 domain-containing protein [Lacticaseibacillus rhamnosus]